MIGACVGLVVVALLVGASVAKGMVGADEGSNVGNFVGAGVVAVKVGTAVVAPRVGASLGTSVNVTLLFVSSSNRRIPCDVYVSATA
jgi:hypothetical protein